MNLPNKLSCLRVVLIPFVMGFAYLADSSAFSDRKITAVITIVISLILFWLAAYTDYLDGNLARKFNHVSNFGKLVDSIADKVLILATMIMLVDLGYISVWIPVITLAREFLVTAVRLIALEQTGTVIAANFWGKLKTLVQMVAVTVSFIYGAYAYWSAEPTDLLYLHHAGAMIDRYFVSDYSSLLQFYYFNNALAWISVIITVLSGLTYWYANRKLLKAD